MHSFSQVIRSNEKKFKNEKISALIRTLKETLTRITPQKGTDLFRGLLILLILLILLLKFRPKVVVNVEGIDNGNFFQPVLNESTVIYLLKGVFRTLDGPGFIGINTLT